MASGLRRVLGIKNNAKQPLGQATQLFDQLNPPSIEEQRLGPTELSNINLDPATRAAQMKALQGMQDIATQGGMTAMDKARMQEIADQQATQQKGEREAITQNAAMRGVGGSGVELAGKLSAQQGASTNAARQAVDVNSAAQQRGLQALQESANLGGQINQQDYTQAANKANAQDTINKFNSGLFQQRFNNQFAKTQGQAGALGAQAENQNAQSQRQAGLVGNVIGAAGQVGAELFSDERAKEDIHHDPGDFDEFLSRLQPKKYKYKDPSQDGAAPGQQFGIMAQDLEKTPIGESIVRDTPEGKMIDGNHAIGVILGSLAELHKQINRRQAHA